MKVVRHFYIIILFVILFSVNLYSQRVELINGIRIIHNEKAKSDSALPLSLELIRTIGGIDVQDENYVFVSPQDIVLDSSNNIYILDNTENRIQKYNSEAGYIETIGEGGQGPSDFNSPFSIDIDSDDNLYVLDSMNRRIQILNKKTESIEIIKYKKFRHHILRVRDSNTVALGGRIPRNWVLNDSEEVPNLIEIMDREGNIIDSFGETTDYKDRLLHQHANRFYYDVDNDGNYYLSFRYQNRIDKYNIKGELIWKADRVLNFGTKVIDKGHIDTSRGGLLIHSPTMNIVSNGITVDHNKRLWVITYNRQMLPEEMTRAISAGGMTKVTHQGVIKKMDIFKLEIFNSDGSLLGEIPINHLANGIRIQKNYLFIWEDENVQIYQYRIIEP